MANGNDANGNGLAKLQVVLGVLSTVLLAGMWLGGRVESGEKKQERINASLRPVEARVSRNERDLEKVQQELKEQITALETRIIAAINRLEKSQ